LNCIRVREALPLYVGGDLDPSLESQVAEHLKSCSPCFRVAASFRAALAPLRRLAADRPTPEGLEADVLAAVDAVRRDPVLAVALAPNRGSRRYGFEPAALAALLLLGAGLGFAFLGSHRGAGGSEAGARPIAPTPAATRIADSGRFGASVPLRHVRYETPRDLYRGVPPRTGGAVEASFDLNDEEFAGRVRRSQPDAAAGTQVQGDR
jgi:hypothetical protein